MCGIAGIIHTRGRYIQPSDIQSMSESIAHRGPDDLGYLGWRGGGRVSIHRNPENSIEQAEVAFAHRRLSIIDEGEGGWQPMATADGKFAITYNGEIYNYIELKAELEQEGVVFTTRSDTEVLLQALVCWGAERTLPKLVGMFAFALLDTAGNTVTLARDAFGIKPLSYAQIEAGLAFASELTSLLELSAVKRTIRPKALYDYLRFGFTDRGAQTLFDSINHLPAGHFAVVDVDRAGNVEPQCYWRAELKPVLDITFEDAAQELRNIFMENVRLHLRSDVAVGATLSGGIDSSAVVGAMRDLEGSELDLHTFTFIAPGSAVDEERWADMAGQRTCANMHKISMTGTDLVRDLDGLIKTQGEPFGSTSIYAQNRIFKLAADNNIKVILDGQGADEILAGYVPFISARLATMLKQGKLNRALGLLNATNNAQTGVFMRACRFMLPNAMQVFARKLVGEDLIPGWMDRRWFSRHGVLVQAPQKNTSGDVLRHELLQSLTDRILPSLLRYQDRNSMAYSVESRVPFLTTRLVDFLYSLPEEYLMSDKGVSKAVFRKAASDLAPDAILNRRDKIGFAPPEDKWLSEAQSWLEDVLGSERLRAIGAFDSNGMRKEIESVRSGAKVLTGDVWRWVNLVRWAEQFDVEFPA